MQELRLVAVSEDGTYAVLAVPGRGGRFSLPIDDRLRTVARGQFSRLAQYEIEVENPLRPKEIQDRIRAGETAEEIADVAGIPIDRVRRFEGPVLAEREYRAQEAQRSTVRGHTESGPGPRLGEIVLERLADAGSSPDSQAWDSHKRADGNWQVQLQFVVDGRPQIAEWVFDPRRRQVIPADDIARRLSLPQVDWPARLGSLGTPTATVTPIGSRLGAHQADPRPEPDRALVRGVGAAPAQHPYQPGSYQPGSYQAPEPSWPRESGREAERPAQAGRDVVAARAAQAPAAQAPAAQTSAAQTAAAQTAAAAGAAHAGGAQAASTQPAAARAPSGPAPAASAASLAKPPAATGRHASRTASSPTASSPTASSPTASSTAASPAAPSPAAPTPAAPTPAAPTPAAAPPAAASATAAPSAAPSSAASSAPPAAEPAAMTGSAAHGDGPAADDEAQPAAPEPRAPSRPGRKAAKGRRASVPSWDEIMLGNSRQPD